MNTTEKKVVFILHSKNKKLLPWMILAGIILIRGFASGLNVIAGLFLAPVTEELGIGVGTLTIYLSVMSVVQVLWFSYAGKLFGRWDVRIVAGGAAILQALSFAGFSFMRLGTGWYVLAIPQALGAAILVNLLAPILIQRWFPANPGFFLGLQSACVGLFGAVLQTVTAGIIEAEGWRSGYLTMGLVAFGVMFLAAAFLLRNKPDDAESAQQAERVGVGDDAGDSYSPKRFRALLLFMLTLTGVAVFVQHVATYGTSLGYSMSQVGTAMSLSSVGTAFGALAIGILADKIGGVKTCYLILGLWLTAVAGFMLSGINGGVFAVSAFLNGLSVPGITVLAPILTMEFFGKQSYERIYARVSMGAPLASIFLVPLYGYLYDVTKSYAIVLGILVLLILCAGGAIAYGQGKDRGERRKE